MLYKVQNDLYNFNDGRARCDQDSDEAGVPGFLSFPMPKSHFENQIYYDIVSSSYGILSSHAYDTAYLDIVEVLPITNPRSWVYRDGSPATYLNWDPDQPNNPSTEHNVQIGWDQTSKWNNLLSTSLKPIVCTYSLPAGAQNTCPWLYDFAGKFLLVWWYTKVLFKSGKAVIEAWNVIRTTI